VSFPKGRSRNRSSNSAACRRRFCSEARSPLGWEHINLTGDYVWSPAKEMTENRDGYLPLRPAQDPALMAA
jgi:hypothetical protein